MFPEEKVETTELANGAPPQVAEEAKPEEPAPEADQPEPELEPEDKEGEADDPEISFKTDTVEETKPEEETETKVDESEKVDEVVLEPAVPKVSLITKIKGAVCGLVGKIVGFFNSILTKVLSLINLIVTKVLSLVNFVTDAIKTFKDKNQATVSLCLLLYATMGWNKVSLSTHFYTSAFSKRISSILIIFTYCFTYIG